MRIIRGRKALVTGAAAGIGRAIALALAREGADLFLIDIDAAKLEAVARRGASRSASRRSPTSAISRDAAQISAAVKRLTAAWGGLDILINNAGVTWYGPTEAMTRRAMAAHHGGQPAGADAAVRRTAAAAGGGRGGACAQRLQHVRRRAVAQGGRLPDQQIRAGRLHGGAARRIPARAFRHHGALSRLRRHRAARRQGERSRRAGVDLHDARNRRRARPSRRSAASAAWCWSRPPRMSTGARALRAAASPTGCCARAGGGATADCSALSTH